MVQEQHNDLILPSAAVIHSAVRMYLERAYSGQLPPNVLKLLPPPEFDTAQWLMSGPLEKSPPTGRLEEIKSFALRLGNSLYPHMKLRISRPPNDNVFVFSVDCHDAILKAPEGTPDYALLEELKRQNSALAWAIHSIWDAEGLPTEKNYLRMKIKHARLAAGQQ